MHREVTGGSDDLLGLEYGIRPFFGFGRLSSGVSLDAAGARLEAMRRQWEVEYPDSYRGLSTDVVPFRGIVGPQMGADSNPFLLLGAPAAVTLIVLLIACGNVANLLLARSARRRREIAVRLSLGATRGRIVRQLLAESLLLAVLGGAAGILLAVWVLKLLVAFVPAIWMVPVGLDNRVLLATLAVSLITGIVCGLSPALRASRPELTPALKGDAGAGRERSRPQKVLVGGQVALSFVLLVAAGLLIGNLRATILADRVLSGRAEVLTLALDLEKQGYSPEAKRIFEHELIDRVTGSPEVESATITSRLPGESSFSSRVSFPASAVDDSPDPTASIVRLHNVWPGLFSTLSIPLRRGRDFGFDDRMGAQSVAIVNEAAAARFWPGQDPLGREIRVGASDTIAASVVVGVVADALHDRRQGGVAPAVYLPELQRASPWTQTTLLTRTRGRAASFAAPQRELIRELDPDLAIYDVRTIEEVYDQEVAPVRLASTLLTIFGAIALALAMIGLHGVVAYSVVQRTREVGIRLALGATGRQVVALFGRDTMRVAGAGVSIGVLLSAAATQVLASILPGFEIAGISSIAWPTILLLAVAALTGLHPARQAARVDPTISLRAE
jgi:predicted permease